MSPEEIRRDAEEMEKHYPGDRLRLNGAELMAVFRAHDAALASLRSELQRKTRALEEATFLLGESQSSVCSETCGGTHRQLCIRLRAFLLDAALNPTDKEQQTRVSPTHAEFKPNCHACRHSFMEPDDMNLTCGAVSPPFGLYIRRELEHCDGGKKFEQHPNRNPDGTLRIPKR